MVLLCGSVFMVTTSRREETQFDQLAARRAVLFHYREIFNSSHRGTPQDCKPARALTSRAR